jgi:hypothetical protein
MARLEDLTRNLRINIADRFEQRKVADIRYRGDAYGDAELEVTSEHIKIILGGDEQTPVEHTILFSENKTILEMFMTFAVIEDIEIILDAHTAPSANVSSLFYQVKKSILFPDSDRQEYLEIFLGSFYEDAVYHDAIADAVNLVREGRDLDDLEEGDVVYVKWIASFDLCKKRAAALVEALSKLRDVDRETISLGGKISVSSDTGQSADMQAIADSWLKLAENYEGLAKKFLEDNSVAMPEVVLGHKVFEDNISGAQYPEQNIDLSYKIRTFKTEQFNDNLIFTWGEIKGKDFKEYRIYGSKSDFYIPLDYSKLDDVEGINLITTIKEAHLPEYIYEDYYAEADPDTIFYLICLTVNDRVIKSNKVDLSG